MKRIVPVILVLAALSGTVRADYYTGLEAYERGDYEAARREWLPLALAGDAETQYRLGRMYYHGQLGPDDAEAAKWYRLAAERSHRSAQNNLGLMYEQGRGVPNDPETAADWYRRAAEQGLAVAQVNLARMYDEGRGVAEDPAKAARWYERAASQKHVSAQYRLARMYDEGRGVERSPKKAAKWYRRAAKNGSAEARVALREVGYRQFAEEAAEWADTKRTERGPEPGAPPAPPPAAAGIEPPPARPAPERPAPAAAATEPAVDELQSRAAAGDPKAQFAFARRWATGAIGKPDMEQAARWYVAAAEGGHARAAYEAGLLYYRGRGVRSDLVQAHRWLSLAAERGVGDAERWLAEVDAKLSKKERAETERLLAGGSAD